MKKQGLGYLTNEKEAPNTRRFTSDPNMKVLLLYKKPKDTQLLIMPVLMR